MIRFRDRQKYVRGLTLLAKIARFSPKIHTRGVQDANNDHHKVCIKRSTTIQGEVSVSYVL